MLEKEIKLMLSEDEYLKLCGEFDISKEIYQVNHYYRSAECAKRRISVRVREVEGSRLLQVKLPVSTEGSLAVREERERVLDSVPEEISADVLEEICGVRDTAVRIGSLATVRKLCCSYEGVELALDRNVYLGITDHELEAEYTGPYPEQVIEKLRELGINCDRPAVGKYARFCAGLEEK
ncbi:MAG: CYTH domain-containing protein [Ruminococcus sp.]|nr:CYTH domain-containing protein [Ruminococcus sp.]